MSKDKSDLFIDDIAMGRKSDPCNHCMGHLAEKEVKQKALKLRVAKFLPQVALFSIFVHKI
jgi:hypothetical protein